MRSRVPQRSTSVPDVAAGHGTLCIRRAARTPLVVTPMQAVSAGPRRAPRSILPLTPSSCLRLPLYEEGPVVKVECC
jgi:hypothetical protein